MSREMPDKNAAEILALFRELDGVMQERNVQGSILVVGGAAIALQTTGHRVTRDIDALFDDSADFIKCIQIIADKHGFESNWLNRAICVVTDFSPPAVSNQPTHIAGYASGQ